MSSEAYLQRAERYLRSADLLLRDGDAASSVSRSYYAMYHAAQAALQAEGIDAGTHRGVISTFGQTFVKEGPFAADMGRALSDGLRERNLGEYEPSREIPEEVAHDPLERAHGFVDRIRAFLSSRGLGG